MCALSTSPTPVSNTFAALGDDKHDKHDEIDDEVIEASNGWAHKVHRQPKKHAKKMSKRLVVLIEDEAELDAAHAENSLLAARLPG